MPELYKCLEKANHLSSPHNLPSLKKETISEAFGMIYERASYNVKECVKLEPVAFFAKMMKGFSWADPTDPELFWKFTYRAHMSRSIFFETQPGAARSPLHPMIKYLDQYKDAFYKEYPQKFDDDYFYLPPDQQDPQEVERITKRFNEVARVTELYFPVHLTLADYEGDGTDKKIVVKGGKDSTYGYVLQNKRRSYMYMRKRLARGIEEGWLQEDGTANLYYREPQDDSEQSYEDDEQADEFDDDDDDDEEEYRTWLHDYELEYDIYMGRRARNPEEDT
ncbi:hypothetical protein PG988_006799 [Apiospora saccharicola]